MYAHIFMIAIPKKRCIMYGIVVFIGPRTLILCQKPTPKVSIMKQIIDAQPTILGILGKAQPSDSGYRLMKYCVPLQTAEGTLLFHTLTRELLLLTPEEFACACTSTYLKEHWFVIPDKLSDRELAEMVRWVRKNLQKSPKEITNYTILTTTDCNARCFYCYERGCSKISMDRDTANGVISYIQEHCGGQKVKLSWFGGEPLVNYPVIDQICNGLRSEGILFESRMISNAYLFDDAMIARATDLWSLKTVQVTLDGTEAVYNRSKAFIYHGGSPYQVVTANIHRLLDAGISVVIRLNIGPNNAEDLMTLADELAVGFGKQKGLRVYTHLLFDPEDPEGSRHSAEAWDRLYTAQHRLEDRLAHSGLSTAHYRGLRRDLPLSHCMADSGNAVVIVPDGHIGLCEHYTESEFIGHIDSPGLDNAVIASWREQREEIPECGDCFYFPECVSLKKCTGSDKCCEHLRDARLRSTRQGMMNEYLRWQRQAAGKHTPPSSTTVEPDGC